MIDFHPDDSGLDPKLLGPSEPDQVIIVYSV